MADIDDIDEELERAARRMCGLVEDASVFMALMPTEADVKMLLELGAAVFYDKPIVVVAPPGREVPDNLRRMARAVIAGDLDQEATQARIAKAIKELA